MAILFVMALSFQVHSQLTPQNSHLTTNQAPLTISLITCYPGEEIYELCGHSAIRVRGQGIDSVWNYGIFDFNQPNFVYRFVKGETDYRGASYPFKWFMPEYIQTGRKVVEQDLNLTPQEVKKLLGILRTSVLPENAVYRYNYIKDNCSLRILNAMDSATDVKIIYPDSVRYGTYRDEMRAYHEGYPWYQFGIDLALGSGLDQKTGTREEMFVPIEVMRNAASAHFADGRPLVKATRVLNTGRENAVLPPTPWFLAPIFWAWILTLIIACVVAWNIINQKLYLPLYGVWFFMLGLAGCLIAFLVFVSVHESTSPNVLIFWLNPLQFLFTISMGIRKLRVLSFVMAYYNIIAVGILLVTSPFLTQSFNPAFYPLMLSTFALACSYAIIRNKSSYRRR
ncbi:MAG: DUF4105 domain-containing protein [Muribaculaceae bacterium]|nr:DUF4105 domain-containing protein [Muribaculaceae bacterium]